MRKLMKWIGKILGIGVLGLIALTVLLYLHESYFPWEDKARERAFNRKLEEKIAAGEEKIYLRDLTDFEWDRVCVTSVYWKDPEFSNYESILKIIGNKNVDFYMPGKHNYESGIFFIKDKRIIPIYVMEESVGNKLPLYDNGVSCSFIYSIPVVSISRNKKYGFNHWEIVQ